MPMSAVLSNIDLRGSTMGSRKEFQDMVKFVAEHEVHPVVSRVVSGKLGDLDKWEDLYSDMKQGKQFGKLVYELQPIEGGSKL
jgi:D-arabinose 1-dehydrogenase-like Zn-dependent alcohol dehydrogenase